MSKMNVEKCLMDINFSRFSNVKDSLKQRLVQDLENELSLNELDMVAAARGTTYNPCLQHPAEKK